MNLKYIGGGGMADWEGNAADSFEFNFVQPFTDVREAHLSVTGRIAACFAIAKGVVDCGQQSLMNHIATTKKALDDQLKQRHDSNTASGISADTVALIGGTISLIGGTASLTGVGAGPGAVAGVVGGGISYAAEFLPDDAREDIKVDVTTAEDTFSTLDTWCRQTKRRTGRQWEAFRTQDVQSVARLMTKKETHGYLYPPDPNLDGVCPGDFYHDSSDQYT